MTCKLLSLGSHSSWERYIGLQNHTPSLLASDTCQYSGSQRHPSNQFKERMSPAINQSAKEFTHRSSLCPQGRSPDHHNSSKSIQRVFLVGTCRVKIPSLKLGEISVIIQGSLNFPTLVSFSPNKRMSLRHIGQVCKSKVYQ